MDLKASDIVYKEVEMCSNSVFIVEQIEMNALRKNVYESRTICKAFREYEMAKAYVEAVADPFPCEWKNDREYRGSIIIDDYREGRRYVIHSVELE